MYVSGDPPPFSRSISHDRLLNEVAEAITKVEGVLYMF